MTRRANGTHTRRYLVVARLDAPCILAEKFLGEYAAVQTCPDGLQLRLVDMHVATRNITQAAGMIEVQVSEEYNVDVLGRQSQALEVAGNSLLLGHDRRVEQRSHRIEVTGAKLGCRDLVIVAADVVQNAA